MAGLMPCKFIGEKFGREVVDKKSRTEIPSDLAKNPLYLFVTLKDFGVTEIKLPHFKLSKWAESHSN